MEKLNQALNFYHMATLKEIASHLNVAVPGGAIRKSWLVQTLSTEIQKRAQSPDFIRTLNASERGVLGVLLKNGGTATQRDVILPLIMAGLVYVDGQDAIVDLPRVDTVLKSLLRKGLIVNLSDVRGSGSRRTFENISTVGLPPEVSSVLPRDLLPFPAPQPDQQQTASPPHIVGKDPENFLRQLFFFWSELRRQPAKALKDGSMAKRDRRRIAESLGLNIETDEDYLLWLYSLSYGLGMLQVNTEWIMADDRDKTMNFWNMSPALQFRRLLELFSQLSDELRLDISTLSQYTYYARVTLNSASEMRNKVLGALKDNIVGMHWSPFSLFCSFLDGGQIGSFVLPEAILTSLYSNLRWYSRLSKEDLIAILRQLEMQAVVIILRELQNFGVVDLGYKGQTTIPTALRVTKLAHDHFTDRIRPTPDRDWQVILQPDFQILAMGPVTLNILASLEWIAEREKLDEGVVTYRVTRESVYQTLQRGDSIQVIQAFLSQATSQPLPQNVTRTLEEWGEQYERIIVRRNITVLQVDDPALLQQLFDDQVLQRYLHRLDECTAWLRDADAGKVERHLWSSELWPALSRGPEADLPHSLRWEGDILRSRHPLPSLYVTGSIRRVAETQGPGWCVTANSVRSAVATGLEVNDIIALLEKMIGVSLSEAWQKQLKAWGNHYGEGKIARVLLLHLESEEALQELRRANRNLNRWLRPLPQTVGLAVVDTQHWEEAQAILAEWGITVEEQRWWS
ncbi:MAG: helicase-associated domain-containing protein [Anaerolineae bacterium]|nr:helicase-associated domain-containing protein [Anaerolineae bacterium]